MGIEGKFDMLHLLRGRGIRARGLVSLPIRRGYSHCVSASSFRLDPELLNERPPFLGIGLHQRPERLWRLSLVRKNVVSETGDPGSHRRIGQRSHSRRIELGDNVLRRASGREKPVPAGVESAGSPISAKVGISGATVERISPVIA